MALESNEKIPMRELEKLTGLTRMTINFYIKEGLLPEPEKTAQNMAYYSQSFVDRLRLIFTLRTEYHFSLAQIKLLLDSNQQEKDLTLLLDVRDRIFQRLSLRKTENTVSRAELIKSTGLDSDTLDWMQKNNLIIPETPAASGKDGRFYSDGIAMGQLIRRLFEQGITQKEIDPILTVIDQIADLQKQLISKHVSQDKKDVEGTLEKTHMMLADIVCSLVSLAVLRKVYPQIEN